MIKEQDIKQFLEENDIAFKESASIIGVILPSKSTYVFGGSVGSALSTQYFTINFNDSGIAVIKLNNVTGKLEEVFTFIPKEEVINTKFNKKLVSYKLEIVTSQGGTLAFRVNKAMVGASWHKENLETILKSL